LADACVEKLSQSLNMLSVSPPMPSVVAANGGGGDPKYEPDELSRQGVVGDAMVLRNTGDDEGLLLWLDDCV
jgi:hypothetical protein